MRANHQQKVEEAIEQAKTLRKAMKAGDMATQVCDVDIVMYFACPGFLPKLINDIALGLGLLLYLRSWGFERRNTPYREIEVSHL